MPDSQDTLQATRPTKTTHQEEKRRAAPRRGLERAQRAQQTMDCMENILPPKPRGQTDFSPKPHRAAKQKPTPAQAQHDTWHNQLLQHSATAPKRTYLAQGRQPKVLNRARQFASLHHEHCGRSGSSKRFLAAAVARTIHGPNSNQSRRCCSCEHGDPPASPISGGLSNLARNSDRFCCRAAVFVCFLASSPGASLLPPSPFAKLVSLPSAEAPAS
jgi:hypothetical protein